MSVGHRSAAVLGTLLVFAGLLIVVPASPVAAQDVPAPPPEPAAQGGEALPRFSETVRVEVVNLEVFVTDRRGNAVTGLDKDDFELLVDGEPVPITNFYAEVLGRPRMPVPGPEVPAPAAVEEPTGPPEQRLHLVIAVDQAHLRPANRRRAFAAIDRFVAENLRREDGVTVASLDPGLEIHADFLNDPAAITRILERISTVSARSTVGEIERRQLLDELARGNSGGFLAEAAADVVDANATLSRLRAYAASEYQRSLATLRALERLLGSLGGVPGRKAVLWVSDGIANRPGEDLYVAWRNDFGAGTPEAPRGVAHIDFFTNYEEQVGHYDLMDQIGAVTRMANASGVTLYALDAEDNHSSDLRSAQLEGGAPMEAVSVVEANLREPLQHAADETGGRRFQASGRLADELARVASDFESFYSLGFAPPTGSDGERLRVEVRVEGQGFRVRHRLAIRPMGDEEAAAATTLSSLLYNAADNPLGLALAAGEARRRDDGAAVLPLRVAIPVDRISLVPRGDQVDVQLSIFVTVLAADGAARPVQRLPFHVSIPADKVAELRGRPVHTTLPVVLREGDRQVAVGVRDDASGITAAARFELTGTEAAEAAPLAKAG